MSEPTMTTHEIEVPGGRLVYDVRGPLPPEGGQRPLLMIGHPMSAGGFATLASFFGDRTVVTYDPRGCDRSVVADAEHTPQRNAEDVHLIVEAIGGGPVDVFGSSGGAVTGLALLQGHPGDVGILVAHEPPVLGVLPDEAHARAAMRKVTEDYHRSGFGAGMARFIVLTSFSGEIPADLADQPGPDPAMFGMPTADDGSRDNVLLSGVSDPVTDFAVDADALSPAAVAPARLVVAAGEESRDQLAGRAAAAIAERLGTPLAIFPSHHGGFNGGEGPYAGKPEAFADRLREVLALSSASA